MDQTPRKPYPTDTSDEEWAFLVGYLTLMTPEAPQRTHDLREVFNALRWIVRAGAPWAGRGARLPALPHPSSWSSSRASGRAWASPPGARHPSGGRARRSDRLRSEVGVARNGRLDPFVYAHGAVVGMFLIAFLFSLGYLAARRDRSPRLFLLGAGVFVVLLAQMGLGELQWRTHLPWGLVLAHVFLAATVWIGTVALATLFWRPNVDLADR